MHLSFVVLFSPCSLLAYSFPASSSMPDRLTDVIFMKCVIMLLQGPSWRASQIFRLQRGETSLSIRSSQRNSIIGRLVSFSVSGRPSARRLSYEMFLFIAETSAGIITHLLPLYTWSLTMSEYDERFLGKRESPHPVIRSKSQKMIR